MLPSQLTPASAPFSHILVFRWCPPQFYSSGPKGKSHCLNLWAGSHCSYRQGVVFLGPQPEPQIYFQLQNIVVQSYRIIGAVVPLYYKFMRRLWVGQVRIHHLGCCCWRRRMGVYNGNPIELGMHALVLLAKPRVCGDSWFVEVGEQGCRGGVPGAPCPVCLWDLDVLHHMVQMFTFHSAP